MCSVFRAQFPIPIRKLDGRSRQTFFYIDFPTPQSHKTVFISSALAITLAKSTLQGSGLDGFTLCRTKHLKRGPFLILSEAMRPMGQAIVITDQVAVKFDSGGNGLATLPMVFPNPCL